MVMQIYCGWGICQRNLPDGETWDTMRNRIHAYEELEPAVQQFFVYHGDKCTVPLKR